MTDTVLTSSKAQVAIEFGYTASVVRHALLMHDFPCAGDLIDYLTCHEDALTREAEAREARERDDQARALREETERLYRLTKCLVCVDEARVILTLPCCHLSLCRRCVSQQRTCPVPDCQLPIIDVITTFSV